MAQKGLRVFRVSGLIAKVQETWKGGQEPKAAKADLAAS